ncbi:transposon-transfer assisting family protein [[Clostridium] scindens]|uniref:transposon-transfer assisting family protein n=1 Tax=Clostridium scindens (strain JCM 10418 / VPI 12708) TaxID=29347 RepID=UPI001D072D9D|nr:transposon-transfer assisting family protein [[Clostridium] scindens]MCB7512450.1 transposon-transfer assisting family protein [bacterium 210917-SL.2.15]MCB6284829.1 transposon-transfer assisting family protein [[Clostridium] scindens]MCB6419533.1 transposon-transfer assisting family protein [[Clostridium] scindens]MCB7191162.1 transposon-transfer assisting family protein [[Clostridium] scindens]MCB7284122.1 transposon-transfer assisting family protein [[Clostridium] scindens]
MNTFTVEETNLLSIYNTGGKRELVENLSGALPYMGKGLRALSERVLRKVDALTEAEFNALVLELVEE